MELDRRPTGKSSDKRAILPIRKRDVWLVTEKISNRCLSTVLDILSGVDADWHRLLPRRCGNARPGDDDFFENRLPFRRLFALFLYGRSTRSLSLIHLSQLKRAPRLFGRRLAVGHAGGALRTRRRSGQGGGYKKRTTRIHAEREGRPLNEFSDGLLGRVLPH